MLRRRRRTKVVRYEGVAAAQSPVVTLPVPDVRSTKLPGVVRGLFPASTSVKGGVPLCAVATRSRFKGGVFSGGTMKSRLLAVEAVPPAASTMNRLSVYGGGVAE